MYIRYWHFYFRDNYNVAANVDASDNIILGYETSSEILTSHFPHFLSQGFYITFSGMIATPDVSVPNMFAFWKIILDKQMGDKFCTHIET